MGDVGSMACPVELEHGRPGLDEALLVHPYDKPGKLA